MQDDVIARIGRLARACAEMAASAPEPELAASYAAMRDEAQRLNDEQHWVSATEFAAEIPTLASLIEIETLDLAWDTGACPHPPISRASSARIREALTRLAGWATGLHLAYETLRDPRWR
jgi:hypothetical protein